MESSKVRSFYPCVFDASRDIGVVVPDMAVEVSEIMATGVVPDSATNAPFTKETDIHEVGHYLRDKIQTEIAAMRLGFSMASQMASAKASTPDTK